MKIFIDEFALQLGGVYEIVRILYRSLLAIVILWSLGGFALLRTIVALLFASGLLSLLTKDLTKWENICFPFKRESEKAPKPIQRTKQPHERGNPVPSAGTPTLWRILPAERGV